MPNNGKTIFQNLSSIMGISKPDAVGDNQFLSNSLPGNEILFATNDKAEYERKLNQYKQEKYLAYQWQRAQVENNMESLASYTAVKLMYRDADLMDGVPEIGTALDIIADETCLHGDTEIKLLNGKTHTIKELFTSGCTDFWCYAVDEYGECKPTHIDKVINKGKKEIYKVSLDDGTEIKCTPEHKWLLTDGRWVETANIKPGDSLMSIYDSLNYLGYEQIKSSVEEKKRLAHQVVSVEKLGVIEEVFDLFNSSVNNCFAVKCKTGHIISHNCNLSSDNQILKISSKSKRIKSILEDLFYNRLQIATTLRMITRGMVKYGNHYMLLNVTKNGIAGWRQLSVYETDRYEGGLSGYYGGGQMTNAGEDLKPDEVRFVHAGMNQATSYSEWQVAHFRMLNDSFFLPYGVSLLHKARRAWRMWSMMEDAMLIYRLDKSIERRVFKIYVGGINDKDVPAFVQEIANNFKRTPIIDPMTGQVDLRKNFLDVSSDYFIPVRDPSAPNPIETLQSAHNDTAMDDINYMQNKIFAAIRVPKQFINFQDAQGKGQNLSLADIRFARMIMGIQQFVLAELNKVAMVHLYLLGFKEELTNFSLALNIPTAQIESLELEALGKRIQTAAQALADPGIGMPMVSLHWVQTNILKLSDNEIKDILGEIRLEKAMAAELQATPMIIKKTGIFDAVDNIYGDYEAMNNPQQQQPQQDQGMGGGLMGGGGALGGGLGGDLGGLGGDMDLDGTPDAMEGRSATGSTDMGSAPTASSGQPLQERKAVKSVIDQYLDMLTEKQKEKDDDSGDEAYMILEKSEKEAKNLDFLIEKVENLIKDDEAFKCLGVDDEEDDTLSGETISDEDLLNDEE